MATNKAMIPVLVGMMLLTGVCNTLLTKYQDMQCIADCDSDHPKNFEQPVLQSLQMFVGESGCWLVVLGSYLYKRSRKSPAGEDVVYRRVGSLDSEEALSEQEDEGVVADLEESQTLIDPTNVGVAKPVPDEALVAGERRPLTGWKITVLALPAICDLTATTLMNAGLLFVAASIYQMTRGALVLFVGLFSVIFLKRHLGTQKWISLFVVVLGVAIVGLAGYLANADNETESPDGTQPPDEKAALAGKALHLLRDAVSIMAEPTAAQTVLGVFMIAGAQIFTASQFVLEESIMATYSMDPIRVVGWEGIYGFAFTLIGMGILHGAIGTGWFNAREAFDQVFTHRTIAVTSVLIMISIGGFNFFGLSVTRSISATSRSTIDTCRTLFIWVVSLGLGWETFKWLQVVGFALLVWGTGVFNEVISPPTLRFLRRRQGLNVESRDG